MERSYFFPPRLEAIPEYVDRVFEGLPSQVDEVRARMAVAEALLNATIYGALGVPSVLRRGEESTFFRGIEEAEARCPPRRGVVCSVRVDGERFMARVRVEDPGMGFSWRRTSMERPGLQSVGGRGLAMMRAGTRALRWNDVGNVVEMDFAMERPVSSTEPPSEASSVRYKGGHQPPLVLVADDCPVSLLWLRRALEGAGFQTVAADGVESALKLARFWEPDAMLVDYQLPETSGLELLRSVRQHGALTDTPVLIVTGHDKLDDLSSACLDAGAWDFVPKRASPREVVARVRRVLRLREEPEERSASEGPSGRNESVKEAARLQAALLPRSVVPWNQWRVASVVVPSERVGGDLIDVIPQGDRLCVLLVDVAGHGVPAALTASAVRALVRERWTATGDFEAALEGANRQLHEDFDHTGQFVALAALVVEPQLGMVRVYNAGCPPVLVRLASGEEQTVGSQTPPLGCLPSIQFQGTPFVLSKVAQAMVVSDGVVEAFAGPKDTKLALERLSSFIGEPTGGESLCSAVRSAARDDGGDRDDMSLVLFEWESTALPLLDSSSGTGGRRKEMGE